MSLKLLVLAVCISAVICGPTGKIAIRNQTPFNLAKDASRARQVPQWSFPTTIKAGSTATVNVEFSKENGQRLEDAAASVVYTFSGIGAQIKIGAQHNAPAPNGHNANLYIELGNQHLDLGFVEGGTITVDLKFNNPGKMNTNNKPLIELIKVE